MGLFLHPSGFPITELQFLLVWLADLQAFEKHVLYGSSPWLTAVGDLMTPITFLTDGPLLGLETSHPDFCQFPNQPPPIFPREFSTT